MNWQYWRGFLTHAAVIGLIQDMMGKDAYLRWADRHWVSGWWTIPAELAVLALVILTAQKPDPKK